MYALPILMSGVLLGTSAVFFAGLLSIITYTTLVVLDYYGVLRPENISNPAVHSSLTYLLRTLSFYPAILLALTIITALVVRVISSREHLELEVKGLGAEKARLGAIVKSMGSAMVTVNTNGEIETVNDAFEDLTGWKQGEVIGRRLDDVLPILDEAGKPVRNSERPMAKLLGANDSAKVPGVQHISQFQYVRKNQSVFPFIGTLAPITVRGRVIGATTVFDDASDIRQVQTLKSNFIALASHQLKTPVAEIKTITEFRMEGVSGELSDKQKQYLQKVYDIADHSGKMISDLLDISILEKNKVGLNLSPVELSAIVGKVETIYESRVKLKGLQLQIIQHDPDLVIVADDSKLVEVIGNLISNAINFTSKGTITVETKRDGDFCKIIVTDQGRGMSTAALNHIFKKEETLPGTAIAEAGSGLGLYLSKQLVLMHGGDIGVLSTSKSGTSLYIKIPLAKQTAPTPLAEA
jgi:two-component system phosphate regulon sensor histidine kinase PhoR